ncbi:MAG: hypothetical protein HFJ25_04935 [Clostridia bacterium]|nr:hypothetical protein [Clostridia bacterium]
MVALDVTIVVLLILAGITITYIMGDNSVFKQASQSKLEYQIAKAREKLEVTLGQAKIFKHTDKKYNQDDYLDQLMKKEIPNIKIADDIVIVDGYAFEIDRSEPKIGKYVGEEKDLVFPKITTNVTLAADNKTATIHITAQEEKNGISKIEIIQEGYILETYECGNTKEEVVRDYIAKQSGIYTIKVYAGVTAREKAIVEGLIASVKYSPNGNKEYKREHQVKVSVAEDIGKIKSIKYQWLQTTAEPAESSFTTVCANGETITGKGYTGTYYLWTLLETESGKTNIERSEGFNFDNEGPTISSFTATKYSETGITLSATAQDSGTGVTKFEFYIDDILTGTETCIATTESVTKSKTITGLSTGSHECMVKVYDAKNNNNDKEVSGTTKLYTWERWEAEENIVYAYNITREQVTFMSTQRYWNDYNKMGFDFDTSTGRFSLKDKNANTVNGSYNYGVGRIYIPVNRDTQLWKIVSFEIAQNNMYYYYMADVYKSYEKSRSYSKGTSKYKDVYSNNKLTYPLNNVQGDYWYVYKGLE